MHIGQGQSGAMGGGGGGGMLNDMKFYHKTGQAPFLTFLK